MIKKFNDFINEEKLHYAFDVKFDIKSVEYTENNKGKIVIKFPDKEVTGEFRISPYGKITFEHWYPKSVFYQLIKMVTDKCEDEEICAKIKKFTKKINENYYELNETVSAHSDLEKVIDNVDKFINKLKNEKIKKEWKDLLKKWKIFGKFSLEEFSQEDLDDLEKAVKNFKNKIKIHEGLLLEYFYGDKFEDEDGNEYTIQLLKDNALVLRGKGEVKEYSFEELKKKFKIVEPLQKWLDDIVKNKKSNMKENKIMRYESFKLDEKKKVKNFQKKVHQNGINYKLLRKL